MKRTTITLPEDLAMLVEEEAKHRHTSVSEVIRFAVRETFVGAVKRSLPFAAVCDDPNMTRAGDLEGALAENWARDLTRDRR